MQALTGVVLAGGRGRRMAGKNKALAPVDGGYLFEYAVQNLSAVTSGIFISSSRDRQVFEDLGFPVVDDGDFVDCGPLAGIFAALSDCPTDYLAIAACDQLELPPEVYPALLEAVTATQGAYACTADAVVPTCAVLPRTLTDKVRGALQARELRLTRFMQAHCTPVSFPEVCFANINSIAALQGLKK